MQYSIGSTYYLEVEKTSVEACAGIECWFAAISLETVIFATTLLLAVIVITAFPLLKLAMRCCHEERERTEAERDAFSSFVDRIRALSPTTTVQSTAGPTADLVTAGMADSVYSIEQAYRDTVMAVEHYDEEYAEPYLENLAEEFGPDVAQAVQSTGVVSQPLQQLLIGKASTSQTKREELIAAIDDELNELHDGHERLEAVDAARRDLAKCIEADSYDAVAEGWFQLERLERECDDIAAARQRSLRNPPMETEGFAFYEYLYQTIEDSTYPVLAETANLLERIRAERNHAYSRLSQFY